MSDATTRAHQMTRTLHEIVNYPEHQRRVETPEYRRTHHQLVVVEDRPCLACGVRQSTLGDPLHNRHGATSMQTHHHVIEWSLAEAIDLDKFNAHIVARERAHGRPGYERDFTQQEMLDWVDHHPDNLWVLCDQCHISAHRGIHSITMPVWSALDLIRDDFQLVPEEIA